MARLVKIYVAADGLQAHAVKNLLEEAGIDARVEGASMATALPIGQATSPRIWVRQRDAERAREVIEQSEAGQPEEHRQTELAQSEGLEPCEIADPGAELAARAWRSAVLGLFLCPPTLDPYFERFKIKHVPHKPIGI